VTGDAWGDGAGWVLERMPTLLGAHDDWSGLDVSGITALARVLRAAPGMRLPSTGLILDSLVPAIIEQKVTGLEARRSWRGLVRRFGERAPGPMPELFVPPGPRELLDIPSWDWHRLGVDLKRQRAMRAVATVANRLEECVDLTQDAALERLQLIPGVGIWTAAETLQRASGHPDAISVGDYHLANMVVHFLTGRPRGTDDEMLELLAPWAGQRQRVVRLIERAGVAAPRYGPRFNYTDIRAI
jgi:3-methyladenine DNA glycosylase/8-oxoguanine DNA glycosylase